MRILCQSYIRYDNIPQVKKMNWSDIIRINVGEISTSLDYNSIISLSIVNKNINSVIDDTFWNAKAKEKYDFDLTLCNSSSHRKMYLNVFFAMDYPEFVIIDVSRYFWNKYINYHIPSIKDILNLSYLASDNPHIEDYATRSRAYLIMEFFQMSSKPLYKVINKLCKVIEGMKGCDKSMIEFVAIICKWGIQNWKNRKHAPLPEEMSKAIEDVLYRKLPMNTIMNLWITSNPKYVVLFYKYFVPLEYSNGKHIQRLRSDITMVIYIMVSIYTNKIQQIIPYIWEVYNFYCESLSRAKYKPDSDKLRKQNIHETTNLTQFVQCAVNDHKNIWRLYIADKSI